MKRIFTFCIILLVFSFAAKAQVSEQEFQALKALYNATGGDNWINRTGWESINTAATKDDVTTAWHGITVENGHVTRVELWTNNLMGNIPDEIGDLLWLKFLNFQTNKLNGLIPNSIGNLTELIGFSVESNLLNGPLPESMGNLTKLDGISLNANPFNSEFPNDILARLINLRGISAYSCGFTGHLGDIFGNLEKLDYLTVSDNKLTGNLPPSLEQLTKLTSAHFDRNNFSGSLPDLSKNSNLDYLTFIGNQFSGTIPESYGELKNIRFIHFEDNNLTGKIPHGLFHQVLRRIRLDNCFFTFDGLEEVFTQLNSVQTKSFHTNKFFPLTNVHLSVNKGEVLTLNAATLSVYNLGGNNNRYKWFKNNVEVYSGNSPSYTVPAASTTDAGIYRFEVTNTVVTGITLKSENITVSIIGGNEAPTDIILSKTDVDENYTGQVATITALDPDAGDTHTFILTTGNGTNDRDNFRFRIEGSSLIINNGANFETTPTLNILLMANDGNGGLFTKAFVITVNDVDEAPVFNGQLTSNTIDENAPNGTVVLPLNAFDPEGATVTFSITSGNENGAFGISGDKLIVADNTKLNYNTKNQYSLMVNASDGKLSSNAILTISLNKINRLPVIANAVFTIDENAPVGTIVGIIEASDPEGEAITLSILTGNDAGAFHLNGHNLVVANSGPLDYETTPQFLLRVNVSDGISNVQATVTINLNNVHELTDNDILSFSVPGMVGDAIIDHVNHTIAITVTGVARSSLVAAFTLSPGAVSNPGSGAVLDFTTSQIISVTAQSGDVREWVVTVGFRTENQSFTVSYLSVYPNPARNFLLVEGIATGDCLTVTTLAGQKVWSKIAESCEETIDIALLHAGVYILLLESPHGREAIRFVKQ